MCVCRSFQGGRSCVFFLSSCSARRWLLLSLLLVLLLCLCLRRLRFSAPCPAADYPSGVTHPLWLQLPVLLLRWRSVCWVCGVFGAALGFHPCAVLFLRGRRFSLLPCLRLPFGVSAFSDTVCLPYCCASGVGLAATLPLCYQCSSCSEWLVGVRGVLHPVSGSSHRGCVCSLGDGVVVQFLAPLVSRALLVVLSSPPAVLDLCGAVLCSLLAFPCLRVGALLAYGVYGASSLRSLQSRLPFVVGPQVSVCPSPALAVGWFGHMSVAPPAAPVCGVSVASFCRLGLLCSLPCWVFAGRFLWFCGPSSWSFLELFTGVLSSHFRCLLVARGSSWIILGFPPSVD